LIINTSIHRQQHIQQQQPLTATTTREQQQPINSNTFVNQLTATDINAKAATVINSDKSQQH